MIINVRGLSGSGKSDLVRRMLARCGPAVDERLAPDGRLLAATYAHPCGARELTVVGCYGRAGGGCDAVRRGDGGLLAALSLASAAHDLGRMVLLEGNQLSFEREETRRLASRHPVLVVALTTPPETCAANLLRRRRLRAAARDGLTDGLRDEARRLEEALSGLKADVPVLRLGFEPALVLTARLLKLAPSCGGPYEHRAGTRLSLRPRRGDRAASSPIDAGP